MQTDSPRAHVFSLLSGLVLLGLFQVIGKVLPTSASTWAPAYVQLMGQVLILVATLLAWTALEWEHGSMPRLGKVHSFHVLIGLAAIVLVNYMQPLLDGVLGSGQEPPRVVDKAMIAAGLGAVVFASSVVVGPIVEEVIFRGFLFRAPNWDRNTLSTLAVLTITSAIFSAAHTNYTQPTTFIIIFLTGLILGIARVASGGLLLPIALHMCANAIVFKGMFFSH
ncbi:CPBP family intramembrane metalloprotease [Pseudomonas aeruginosa]|uniref:CPBP family intramembrane glutamic endopeptidase n=1 Tax=Pseudomonas aeruginosa TaxID=287 RepID=UPI00071B7D63|nr:type II CAAX endopeptidase family protein [Pseudomonas aeruginosa]KSQ21620.1 CPBP family intramembrane metalloprotease [Pseudomonas aeruginosa]RPV61289.1 CPBP family intramembrane metalloprotease [Pseudomonas aeruginosa]